MDIELSNTSADRAVTFLSWDTPFDPRALDLGVVVLSDADSGEEFPGPGLKLNRKLPPSLDDLVEIAPGQTMRRELPLKGFWLPEKDTRIRVHARGEWKAIWTASKAQISEADLKTLAGERVGRGTFESENTVIARV